MSLHRFIRSTTWLIATILVLVVAGRTDAQVVQTVFSFTNANAAVAQARGSNPTSALVLGGDGNYYGFTPQGGSSQYGTVFKVTPAGTITTLVDFTGSYLPSDPARGYDPTGLILASDGSLYGTAQYGGTGYGTIFKITPDGNITTLLDFGTSSTTTGIYPAGGLVQGSDGNFYGTTTNGGASGTGVVYELTKSGTYVKLVDFTGSTSSSDQKRGGYPRAPLVQGNDGNFYGTTPNGGIDGEGTIFKMTPGGTMTTLVDFTGDTSSSDQSRGANPQAALVLGSDGNFYGTTREGGTLGDGTVFRMTPTGTMTTLVDFTDSASPSDPNRGVYPVSTLIQGSDGNFYGSTSGGGTALDGTIFRMSPNGSMTVLSDSPSGSLLQGIDGNFYAMTPNGGSNNEGTIFKMSLSGTITTLVSFVGTETPYGKNPTPGVVQGNDGDLYGMTTYGGQWGSGVVFKVTPAGTGTTQANLMPFGPFQPQVGLTKGSDGNFYGVAPGGSSDYGNVFQVTPSGTITSLASFTGSTSPTDPNRGESPQGGVIQGSDGNFYGTTSSGGVGGSGTVFKMTPSGTMTTLVDFTGSTSSSDQSRGASPMADLVQGSDGSFYGTTFNGGVNGAGTIFRMTPSGSMTTLVDFTYESSITDQSRGGNPSGALIQASDGNFYGTTRYGGLNFDGTVFRMTPAGVMTTLVDFSGGSASNPSTNPNRGLSPFAGLIQAEDGNLYGTATSGGNNSEGTIFKMTLSGSITTLYDNSGELSYVQGTLIQAADGSLYGSAQGGPGTEGSVFRILLAPGVPEVFSISAVPSLTGVAISCSAEAEGSTTAVSVQYGTDGVTFPFSLPVAVNLTGYNPTTLGTTLTNLPPGTTYYYQLVATNSNGTTTSPVQSFNTFSPPLASTSAPTNVSGTSATFQGSVSAFNYDATVVFQWGTDGQTFPNTLVASPGTVTGSSPTTVSGDVAQLSPATTYYYRISATNVGGTTISGVTSFTTLSPPVETVLPASLMTSQSAQLNGTVNPVNLSTPATVSFEYGTDDINFTYSIGAGFVNGTTAKPVSVAISNSVATPLSQGQTYYYRVRGISAGGNSTSPGPDQTFSLDVLSGFERQFPGTPPSNQGVLLVQLSPSGINSGWRFQGEQLWRSPGVPALGLVTGNYTIEYEPVPGYIQPLSETVSVTSGGAATVVSETYYPTVDGATGGLSILLQPSALASDSVPQSQRAQWEFLGQNGAGWVDSGTVVNSLPPGDYLIECKPVSGQTTPAIADIRVQSGQTTVATLTYFVASTPVGLQPAPLNFPTVTNSGTPSLPYAFCGQIRSSVGSATGFVVKDRVVATAAHVIFDDGSFSYVTNLQWLFQRSVGTNEPVPMTPQGSYIFDDYAAQRESENTPGVSSPASQNLDAAAMFFFTSAGNGGYSGYLGSNSNTNEFLVSSRQMILVGYPVDGIPASEQGEMFATAPATATLSQVIGTDTSGNQQTTNKPYQVYTTTSFTSAGGNSGGPLCVQFDDGNYYPAAIYLGGSSQTVVRAIDGGVIDLFDQAEVAADTGQNQTGGGITQVNSTISSSEFAAAALQVNFTPPQAATAATWKLAPTAAAQANGNELATLGPGSYSLYCSTVAGFLPPSSPAGQITLTGGVLSTVTFGYEGFMVQPVNVVAITGVTASFSVTVSGTPTAYQWLRNGSAISGATSATYQRPSLTSADNNSTYACKVAWGSDGSLTSNAAVLTVTAGVGPLTYAQWQTQYSVTGGATGMPLFDGVENQIKYLCDINPTTTMSASDRAALPTIGIDTTSTPSMQYLELTFRQNQYLSGTSVHLQTSTDLMNWSTVTPDIDTSVLLGNGDSQVEMGVKISSSVKAEYIRLNLTTP